MNRDYDPNRTSSLFEAWRTIQNEVVKVAAKLTMNYRDCELREELTVLLVAERRAKCEFEAAYLQEERDREISTNY